MKTTSLCFLMLLSFPAAFLTGCMGGNVWYVDPNTGEEFPYTDPIMWLLCGDPLCGGDYYPDAVYMAVPVTYTGSFTTYQVNYLDVLYAGVPFQETCCFRAFEIPWWHGGGSPTFVFPPEDPWMDVKITGWQG